MVERLEHIGIEAETNPDSPVTAATDVINLWQHNLVALDVSTFVGWQKVRRGAVSLAQVSIGDLPV